MFFHNINNISFNRYMLNKNRNKTNSRFLILCYFRVFYFNSKSSRPFFKNDQVWLFSSPNLIKSIKFESYLLDNSKNQSLYRPPILISIHFNLFLSISNHFQPYSAIFGQFRPFWRFLGFITLKHYFR